MLAQYVYTSPEGMFRIVRHGRRWRALLSDREVGRFDTAEEALSGLRQLYSGARLPVRMDNWRFIPDAPLGHLPPTSPSALARLAAA